MTSRGFSSHRLCDRFDPEEVFREGGGGEGVEEFPIGGDQLGLEEGGKRDVEGIVDAGAGVEGDGPGRVEKGHRIVKLEGTAAQGARASLAAERVRAPRRTQVARTLSISTRRKSGACSW